MRTPVIALLALPALAWTNGPAMPAGFALLQDPSPRTTESSATPSQEPRDRAKSGTPSSNAFSELIEQLGSPDDAVRSRAREALAARGEEARAALDRAAQESKDPEVRWNARKLLRRLEEAQATPSPSSRLERHDAGSAEKPREVDGQEPAPQPGVGRFGRGSSQSVQIGPDGRVKVTVTEEVDGQRETKTYEAESMEELQRQHPDLLPGIRIGRGRELPGIEDLKKQIERLHTDLDGQAFEGFEELRKQLEREIPDAFQRLPRLQDEALQPLRERMKLLEGFRDLPGVDELPPATEPAPHERLGVKIEPLHPEVASFLELPQSTGLLVQEVIDGSLAQRLGLRAKDVILSIQGEAVRTPESIRAALARTPLDAKVRVEVLRFSSGRVTMEAQRPPTSRNEKPASGSAELPAAPLAPKKLEGPAGGK
ncbi:MAG: PDZ domain-containing protein [Planctomycetes bacterium]|nr:PDZ domain-containing protein [Planctomycetota bacterium]